MTRGWAGNQKCYVKFGAVKPGAAAEERFDLLLDACEELAVTRSLARIEAGTNLARHEAYGKLLVSPDSVTAVRD
jgi:hypothetical protein